MRTPDHRFAGPADFPYAPRYCDVDDGAAGLGDLGLAAEPCVVAAGEAAEVANGHRFAGQRVVPAATVGSMRMV